MPITCESMNDSSVKDFYVVLKEPSPDAMLCDPSIAHIEIVEDKGKKAGLH